MIGQEWQHSAPRTTIDDILEGLGFFFECEIICSIGVIKSAITKRFYSLNKGAFTTEFLVTIRGGTQIQHNVSN